MTHRNAPLTPEGRRRAVEEVLDRGRPVSHVAGEFRISRTTLSKWVGRYRAHGPAGLEDASSAPAHRPTRVPAWVVELIESWRREHKWTARRIAHELAESRGYRCAVRTVTRWLHRLGLNRLRDITPAGDTLRAPGTITARYPGHMLHMDVKKVGKIPDGGGWRAHGRGSDQARASRRGRGRTPLDYTYLHSIEDGFSRLTDTEPLGDETAATTIGFFHRARVFFDAHGITRITRLVTDNGANYTAKAFERSVRGFISRHQRTRAYTPRHNREDRALPASPGRGMPLRPGLHQRSRTCSGDQHLGEPLQLPSAPHRLRRPAPGLTHPGPRQQRHDQLQLSHPPHHGVAWPPRGGPIRPLTQRTFLGCHGRS